MGGSGAIIHMIRSMKANRRLQKRTRKRMQEKLNDLNQLKKAGDGKVFNEAFLDESRQDVVENRKRLAIEIKEIQWEDKVKTLISVVLTAMILLFWLEKCWY